MTAEHDCPNDDRLKALLDETLANLDQVGLEQHLESCDECRRRIERLARGDATPEAECATADALAPQDTMLEELRARLKNERSIQPTQDESSANSTISLDFLAPSETAQSLGRLGIYDIIGVIGSGGMGVVLKAHDPRLNRVVAIKVLHPQFASIANARKRFLREAQKAAAVAHEHVVAIHAVDEQDHLPYIVMEYIVGASLDERIKRTGSLQTDEVLRIGMQTARGLAAAHAQGLIHRDIKPSNILLENGVERVKLADFGLARAVDDTEITGPGVVVGTPQYMSPEQTRGDSVDHRGDLFSLGCVMYAMCVGRSPFRAKSVVEAIRRVCDDTPRPIQEVRSDIPEWLVETINRLLEKDADQRIQTAAELADYLEKQLAHLQQGTAVSPLPTPVLPHRNSGTPTTSSRGQRRWFWGAACALVLLLPLAVYMGGDVFPNPPKQIDAGPPPPPPRDTAAKYLANASGISLEEATQILEAFPNPPKDVATVKAFEAKFWWDKMYEFAMDGPDDLVEPAYKVAQAWSGHVNPRDLNKYGEECRKKGRHTAADLFYIGSSDKARLRPDMREVMWQTVCRSRLRRDLHDYQGAERFLTEAIQVMEKYRHAMLANRRAGDDIALHYERANIWSHLQRSEDAKDEFTYVVQKMDEYRENGVKLWWIPDPTEKSLPYLDACLESREFEPNDVIQRLADNPDWLALSVLGKAHSIQGDADAAIQSYKTAVFSQADPWDARFDEREDELLQLYLANPSLLPAARKVFEDLVELGDDNLDPRHPHRAFTRQRLAQTLIREGKDSDAARTVLDEAAHILASHSLALPSVLKEIADLRAEVE